MRNRRVVLVAALMVLAVWTAASLLPISPPTKAYAGPLGDVYKDKRKDSGGGKQKGGGQVIDDEGGSVGKSRDRGSGSKGDGLADWFKYRPRPPRPPQVHYYYYNYYPYDFYYFQFYYAPRPWWYPEYYYYSLPQRDAYTYQPESPASTVYHPYMAGPGTLLGAMQDVGLSWLQEDINLLARHVPAGSQIEGYRGTERTHTYTAQEFLDVTAQAFGMFDTVSFVWGEPRVYRDREAYVRATHTLQAAGQPPSTAQIGYYFYRDAQDWQVGKVNVDVSNVDSSKCFIATAAFGTPSADEVRTLRLFRDRVLLSSETGRKLVEAYYQLSPPLAEKVRQDPELAQAVRALLGPVVSFCRQFVGDGEEF